MKKPTKPAKPHTHYVQRGPGGVDSVACGVVDLPLYWWRAPVLQVPVSERIDAVDCPDCVRVYETTPVPITSRDLAVVLKAVGAALEATGHYDVTHALDQLIEFANAPRARRYEEYRFAWGYGGADQPCPITVIAATAFTVTFRFNDDSPHAPGTCLTVRKDELEDRTAVPGRGWIQRFTTTRAPRA